MSILFIDDNNNCVSDSYTAYSVINDTFCKGTLKFFNELSLDNCNGCDSRINESTYRYKRNLTNLDRNYKVKAFAIAITSYNVIDNVNGNVSLDNFYISNVEMGKNELPSLNFSVSSDVCYNNSFVFQNIPVNLSINASDPENDPLYYGITAQTENSVKFIKFHEQNTNVFVNSCNQPLNLIQSVFYGVFNFLFNPGACTQQGISLDIQDNPNFRDFDSCPWNNNVSSGLYVAPLMTIYNTTDDMLVLNKNCVKKKEAYLDLYNSQGYFQGVNYVSDLYMANVSLNSVNVTFYSSPETDSKVLQIELLVNSSSVVYVYNVNSTGKSLLMNITPIIISDYSLNSTLLGIQYGISYNYSNNELVFIDYKDGLPFKNNTEKAFDYPKITKYIGYRFHDYSAIGGIQYSGNLIKPVFSTTIPTQITLKSSDDYVDVTLYLTDSKHLDSGDFTSMTKYLNLGKCRYSNVPLPSITPGNKDFDLLRYLKYLLSNPLRRFFSSLDVLDSGANIIFWAFVICFVIGCLWTFPNIQVIPVLFLLSWIGAFITFIMDYMTSFIAYLFIAILVTVILLVNKKHG